MVDKNLRTFLTVLTLAVAAPLLSASTISINGTCFTGASCSPPDIASPPTDITTPFTYNYSFASGDRYSVSGTVILQEGEDGGIYFDTPMRVTFLGNGSAGAASTTDTLRVEVRQGFAVAETFSTDEGSSEVAGLFLGSFGSGTEVTYSDQLNDEAPTHLGPFTPGSGSLFLQTVGGISSTLTSPSSFLQLNYNFTFGSGTTPGSAIRILSADETAAIPEPRTYLLGGLGFVTLWGYRRCRRRNA